jgi:hypothetical protein
VEGAVKIMFDSEFFHSKQKNKLNRRLFSEIFGIERHHHSNRHVAEKVTEALTEATKERIAARTGKPYEEDQAKRAELARELTVHPDRSPLVTA